MVILPVPKWLANHPIKYIVMEAFLLARSGKLLTLILVVLVAGLVRRMDAPAYWMILVLIILPTVPRNFSLLEFR
jgi:hypothetical protein